MNDPGQAQHDTRAGVALGAALLLALALLGAGVAAGRAAPGSARLAAASVGLVDINSATEAELRLLPGVGPSLARKIVESRDAQGPFSSVADLDRVPGIGERTVANLTPYATARPAPE